DRPASQVPLARERVHAVSHSRRSGAFAEESEARRRPGRSEGSRESEGQKPSAVSGQSSVAKTNGPRTTDHGRPPNEAGGRESSRQRDRARRAARQVELLRRQR